MAVISAACRLMASKGNRPRRTTNQPSNPIARVAKLMNPHKVCRKEVMKCS